MGITKQEENEVDRIEDVVVVNPKPSKGITSKAIDWIESLIVKYMYDSSVPHHWLSGNFAPVDETPPASDLPVVGHLPVIIFVHVVLMNLSWKLRLNSATIK